MNRVVSEAKINHHFIPQGLLRNWYCKDLSKGKNKGFRLYKRNFHGEIQLLPNLMSSKSSCSEKHLNTTYCKLFSESNEFVEDTDSIEDELGKLDNDGIEIINKILASNKQEVLEDLSENDRNILSKFIVSLHLRSPETIKYAKALIAKNAKDEINYINMFAKSLKLDEHSELFQKTISMKTMMDTLNMPSSYQHVKNMNWLLIENEESNFFSGERPLIVNFSKDERELNLGFALSLSPAILMIGIHKKILDGNFEKQIEFIQNFTPYYNDLVCKQSKYIITSKELPEDIFKIYVEDNLS